MTNRGYKLDELLAIGHLEATLSHLDEYVIARDYSDLARQTYTMRKDLEQDLLNKCEDANFWCVLKHLATAYVMTAEMCHAREYDMNSVLLMNRAGDCLASACESALGIEKSECLRCLSERLGKEQK